MGGGRDRRREGWVEGGIVRERKGWRGGGRDGQREGWVEGGKG